MAVEHQAPNEVMRYSSALLYVARCAPQRLRYAAYDAHSDVAKDCSVTLSKYLSSFQL